MPRIRTTITKDVPKDDCRECDLFDIYRYIDEDDGDICLMFNNETLLRGENNRLLRCQKCLDAEVKENKCV
ncbi:MAG: hypothetical protein PHO27_12120 [Sulfuricurvum sp.]|jgi:hypothetical protein|nr:hypothetical protein [Sulfuricurvum sp.]